MIVRLPRWFSQCLALLATLSALGACGGGFTPVQHTVLLTPAPLPFEPGSTVFEHVDDYGRFPGMIASDGEGELRVVYPGDDNHPGLPIRGVDWPLVMNDGQGRHYPEEHGLVSFYHAPQRLATGEWFDPDELTAAHKTLPFGTVVRCTRTDTGQSVVVTINDRGPYVRGRILDLSRKSARLIDLPGVGVAPCKVEVLAYPLVETMGPRGNG